MTDPVPEGMDSSMFWTVDTVSITFGIHSHQAVSDNLCDVAIHASRLSRVPAACETSQCEVLGALPPAPVDAHIVKIDGGTYLLLP
ncbi:hypothetical protein CCM_00614 [Cordyceps militaris CM01]|uniref:Uncharacterized protein n=1 Tax=Cordyceps militaris (strain CM01) TaxID=983644 RepID=G3J546_CORMM|nr:uncharacterized protein CCM_00614 [Cordyceps militaris CM01]EGX95960.1 hypothetical protein CCM_00614 [Cordyceps militaris CM01]